MDAVQLVDDVPEQVAAAHSVVHAAKDGGDHIAPSVSDTSHI